MATSKGMMITATQIRFSVAGSLSPADVATNYTMGTPTDVVLTLAGVAAGEGRQSTKADLGTPWAPEYAVFAAVDFTGESVASGNVSFYWAPSTHTTDANGNIWGNSGVDADCPGGAVGTPTLAQFLTHCIQIGLLPLTDDAGVQAGYVGSFRPPTQWGQMIVVNNEAADPFEDDNVEMHVVMNPVIPQGQAT